MASASRVTRRRTCVRVAPRVRSSASSRLRCCRTTRKVEETTIEATRAATAGKIMSIAVMAAAPRWACSRSDSIAAFAVVTSTPSRPLRESVMVDAQRSCSAVGGFPLSSPASSVATMSVPEGAEPMRAVNPASVV